MEQGFDVVNGTDDRVQGLRTVVVVMGTHAGESIAAGFHPAVAVTVAARQMEWGRATLLAAVLAPTGISTRCSFLTLTSGVRL